MSTRQAGVFIRAFPFIVGLFGALVYWGSIANGFTFDDPHIVVENPLVAGDGGPARIFLTHYWGGQAEAGTLYRPLTVLTYWVNYRLAGAVPWSYHLVNVALHGLVTAVFYLLSRRLAGPAAAAAAALLFAAHPIHTEAVASIVGRAELLAALFVLAAWMWRERPWLASALFACGMLSKENAVVLPGLLLVEDLTIGRARGPSEAPARRYGPFVAALAGYGAVRLTVVGPSLGSPEDPFAATAALPRILTAVDVIGRYLRLMAFPTELSADYSYNQIPLVTSLADARFLTGAAVVLACLAAALLTRRRSPAVAAGLLSFLVAVAPVSNVFFGIGVMMAERLTYLPSSGLCLAAGAALASAVSLTRAGRLRLAAVTGLAAMAPAAVMAVQTWQRCEDWFDNRTLFEATVRTSPDSALAQVNLGAVYQSLGRLAEAEDRFRRAAAIAPDRPGPHFNRATVLRAMGRRVEAIAAYREAARLDPANATVLADLGTALLAEGMAREAIVYLERSVLIRPGVAGPAAALAAALLQVGEPEKAARLAQQVLEAQPDEPTARRVLEELAARGGG